MLKKIPQSVKSVIETLDHAGFEAFVVGGSVRDLVLNREPRDWDITTNAKPEEILKLFSESFYENEFGTVGVKAEAFTPPSRVSEEAKAAERIEGSRGDETTSKKDIIEVTTYRRESGYADKRHPSAVAFTQSLEEDLGRRDFTINALAYGPKGGKWQLVDPFQGEKDIEVKLIRTVGKPEERFREDALRLLRAIRLWAELRDPREEKEEKNWRIEEKTFRAIRTLAANLKAISQERLRDELSKIILSPSSSQGIERLHDVGLLASILPELEEGIGVSQNLHHIYTVWEHNLRALATCPSEKLSVRLAALLHDVGKPRTKSGVGKYATFYNHDHVGARLTEKMLDRLRYPKVLVKHAALLVDNHLFYYNVGEVTEASVRRLIKRVGLENMADLMAVRIGDRLGSGVPKAKPYKLRHLEYMIEKVSRDPLSVKMLALTGTDLMESLGLPAGPKIGAILDVLLAEVIEDPRRNSKAALLERAKELEKEELEKLRERAKNKIEEKRASEDRKIKKRHWVE